MTNSTDATDRIDDVLALADAGFKASLARLEEILSIPSISTDPAYDGRRPTGSRGSSRILVSKPKP